MNNKHNNEYQIVGKRPVRPDAFEKITGKALFGADFFLPGMLYGKVLRSPHAHARILNIDTDKASALPGVRAVVTGRDFPYLRPEGIGDMSRDNLALEKVLYHGHGVAAVAADSLAIAEAALLLIEVDYEVLPVVLSIEEAMKDKIILHDHLYTRSSAIKDPDTTPSNIYQREIEEIGDVAQGFAEADLVLEREFRTPMVHQGYIEPPACLAQWQSVGQSTIWTTTQGHFIIRQLVARMIEMEQSALRVIPTEIGGGFGGKTTPYCEALALMLSKLSGKPVKMTMTREETFRVAGPGAGTLSRIRIGATKSGKITAMDAWIAYESGAFPAAPLGGGMRSMFSSYQVPNQRIEGLAVVMNKPKIRAYRGPGASQATFGTETLLNEMAGKLNLDPIEFRLMNIARDGTNNLSGGTLKSINFEACLNAAKNSAHYQSSIGENTDTTGFGRAIAVGFWRNGGNVSSAEIHMNADGSASLVTGSSDLSGTRISLAMMAAEELQMPLEKIASRVGDTEMIGFTSTSGGSRTINATGQAVVNATRDAIHQMKQRAASGWNVPVEEVTWQSGKAVCARLNEEMRAKDICKNAPNTGGPITGRDSLNVPPGVAPSLAVHICDVAVDKETGQTRLLRYTTVQDAGRAIHPDYVEGQLQGGAVQGIGWALNEEYVFDESGVLQNPGFLDYRIPLASDLPMIETVIVEVPNPLHPYGVRGVGESPIVPPLAAVASAISSAIMTPMTELPCSPPRVLKAIQTTGPETVS